MTLSDNGFQHNSFVNSIATTKGGTHVNHVTDQLVKILEPLIAKKNKVRLVHFVCTSLARMNACAHIVHRESILFESVLT